MTDAPFIPVLALQVWTVPAAIFLTVTGVGWMACRFLNRHLPRIRHLPWMLSCLAGAVGFTLGATSEPTGSSMGAALEGFVWMVAGSMAAGAGLVSMILFLFFPGTSPRREAQGLPAAAPRAPGSPGAAAAPRAPGSPGAAAGPRSPDSYAVLLDSLERTPTREEYANAAVGVPGVTVADQRGPNERLGILIQRVDAETARLFHTALAQLHIPTRVFAESELFPLPMGRRVRALRLQGDMLWETDMMGREHPYPLDQLLRCCGGRIEDLVLKQRTQIKTRAVRSMGTYIRTEPCEVKSEKRETTASLRFEWFFRREPYRLIWTCDREARLPLNREPVGPDNAAPFEAFLREVRARVPADKTNIGIRSLDQGEPWIYPSVASFEMETIWALTRCSQPPGGTR